MPLHRLIDVPYNGGTEPATHDKINTPADNGDPGLPALSTGKLATSGHANEGTYYVGFSEDGLSQSANRPHDALAQNTDYLDDICTGDVPVPAELEATASGAVSSLIISGDVFVGMSGIYVNTQPFRDRLIKIIDNSTGNDMVDNSGVKVECSRVRNTADVANAVGVPSSGFEANPTVGFSPSIPNGRDYRIIYGRRSTLAAGIRTKVDLDLLVRLAIRAAQQASAETIRFITQAARRTGGNITALSTALIETPRASAAPGGSILAESNSFILDIDPGNSFAQNGTFSLAFDRDGTPRVLFGVSESPTLGLSYWESAERIALRDVNTAASGFTVENLPLSSGTAGEGDDNLRLLGEDPGAQSATILKRLNATWTVTVGDGVDTFGDFNGVDGLTDAVAHAATVSHEAIHILLKKGIYSVDNLTLGGVAAGQHIIIEGVTQGFDAAASGAIVQNIAALGSTSAGITSSFGIKIEFRGISFTKSSTSTLAFYGSNDSVRFKDCSFNNQSIRLDVIDDLTIVRSGGGHIGSNFFEMRNCSMLLSASTSPPVHVAAGGTSPLASGFLFQDCHITSITDLPILRIENLNLATAGVLSGVLFDRCVLVLGTTSDDGGGDLTGNSGALELVQGTTSFLSVADVTWKDCIVTAVGAGALKPLLYLRQSDGTGTINVSKVKISGGTWSLPAESAVGPIYIGSELYTTTSATRVTIENLEWGYSATGHSNGAPTTEVTGPVTAGWAFAVVAGVGQLRMHNITWLNNTEDSDSGDLFIYNVRRLDVDGIYLGTNFWTAGTGASPEFRIKVVGGSTRRYMQMKLSNILVGGDTGIAGYTVGAVVLQPSSNAGSGSATMVVTNLHVTDFSSATSAGVMLLGGANDEHVGLHLVDCHISGIANNGFEFIATGSYSPLKDLVIRGCTFEANTGYGVAIDNGLATLSSVRIVDNLFANNTLSGLVLLAGTWDNDSPGFVFGNNEFDTNNTTADLWQARINPGATAVGTMYGNSAGASSGNSGRFLQTGGPSNDFLGTESGYTYIGGSGGGAIEFTPNNAQTTVSAAAANRRTHNPDDEMVHNRMRWVSA